MSIEPRVGHETELEPDSSFRFRIETVATSRDRRIAQTASGQALDAIGRKYGLVRRGLDFDFS